MNARLSDPPPALVVGLAAVLFALVVVLRLGVLTDTRQAATLLFVVPIVLCASLPGFGWGLGAAAASSLAATLILAHQHTATVATLGTRSVTFFIVAVTVCHLTDQLRRAAQGAEALRLGTQLNDQVLQELLLARYELQARECQSVRLDQAIEAAREIVTAGLGPEPQPGDLRVLPNPDGPSPGRATD